MPCDACGCTCADNAGGGVAPMEVDDDEQVAAAAALLMDAAPAELAESPSKPGDDDGASSQATTTAADDDGMVEEEKPDSVLSTLLDYVPDCVLDYLPRGLFLLLWVYLLDWMRRFALRYTNGSTWFSTFAALVMAIPMTEFFLINGMLYLDEEEPPPLPPAAGTRELIAAELRHVFTKPDDSIPIETTQEKSDRCFLRGLLVLVWLIAIDFGRRSLFTNDFGEVDILLAVPIVMWVILTSTMFLVMAGLYIEGLLPT